MAVEQIQEIIDRLVTIQAAVVKPAGEKALVKAYDEPPAKSNAYPCFVNIEREIPLIERGADRRAYDLVIDMHLLFSSSSKPYSARRRRLWLQPVLDAFDKALKLDTAGPTSAIQHGAISRVLFDPVEINLKAYPAITFVWIGRVRESFGFEP